MKRKIPTTIITGFLGAGKTTLIRHLLATAAPRRLALIVNEFGDVGVDGELLKACGEATCRAEDIIELANGCICCTVADDFIPTMNQLLARTPAPDHIIIETSGLALPQPLLRAFNWPEIAARVTIDGVITLVDGKALAEGRYADDEVAVQTMRAADPNLAHENPIAELFDDQVNCADLIVLTKTDLLEPTEIASVKQQIASRSRKPTPIITSSLDQPEQRDVAVLLGQHSAAEADLANRQSTHELEGETQHDHDDFISFHVTLDRIESKEALLQRLQKLLHNGAILRLKGFAQVEGSDARLAIQAVGSRLSSYFDRPWHKQEPRLSQLVVIGVKGLDKDAVLSELCG